MATYMTSQIEFFTNSPQYKNANIVNFVFVRPLEIYQSNETFIFKM